MRLMVHTRMEVLVERLSDMTTQAEGRLVVQTVLGGEARKLALVHTRVWLMMV